MNQAPTRRKIIPKQRQIKSMHIIIKSIHIIKKVGLMNQTPTEEESSPYRRCPL
jgi:hypothetical protein